jgi:hypothetical protein
MLFMPFKHNSARRHRIPKMKFRVTNWAEYESGLRERGSVTFWLSNDALAAWHAPKRNTRGGQPRYSDLAIEASLKSGLVFDLPLRQIEGFLLSIFNLMNVKLPIPDHTTLSRRSGKLRPCKKNKPDENSLSEKKTDADKPLHVVIDSTGLKIYGAGQWLEHKHGARPRREWRKLHLAIDADTGEIITEVLTVQDESDTSQLKTLLGNIDGNITQFTADGAYDGRPTYDIVLGHSPDARILIPPRSNSNEKDDHDRSSQRDAHITAITQDGRIAWQTRTGYGKRSLVETAIGRYKSLIGNRLRARKFANQQTEATLACEVLNRMLSCARPKSVRVKGAAT